MTDKLKVKVVPGDVNVNSQQNAFMATYLEGRIAEFPGGEALIADATQKGDITIALTSIEIPGGAHWHSDSRAINIQLNCPVEELMSNEDEEDRIVRTVLFELCNAANPLLEQDDNPLSFDNAEDYAKEMERREFKSHQRRCKIQNAAIDAGLEGWNESHRLREYKDAEFGEYYKSVACSSTTKTAGFDCHADYYRKKYQMAAQSDCAAGRQSPLRFTAQTSSDGADSNLPVGMARFAQAMQESNLRFTQGLQQIAQTHIDSQREQAAAYKEIAASLRRRYGQ